MKYPSLGFLRSQVKSFLMPTFSTLLMLCLLGCASASDEFKRYGRGSAPARAAAFAAYDFTYSKPQHERPKNDFNFFYKECSVEDRHPFPRGAEWICSEP